MICKNRSLQDPPVCYVCAFQQLWAEVGFSDVKVVNRKLWLEMNFPDIKVVNQIAANITFSAIFHSQLLLPDLQPDKLGWRIP